MKKTKRLLAILFTALSSFVFLFSPAGFLTAQTEQAQWSAVMAGETLHAEFGSGAQLYRLHRLLCMAAEYHADNKTVFDRIQFGNLDYC